MQYLMEKKWKLNILKTLSLIGVLLFLVGFSKPLSEYNLISSVPMQAKFLTTDFLKSAYIINPKNQVMKYDSTGTLIAIYSENKYGPLTAIDATSPFNTLMFHKDEGYIVSVDMKMSPKTLYKLSATEITNISAMCLSHDNNIWVYDSDENKLKKIAKNYDILYKSIDVTLLLGEAIEPNFLVEKNGLIYLGVPNMGIIMFDIFGTYYTSVPNSKLGVQGLANFQVINRKIVYFHDGLLHVYDFVNKDMQKINIPKIIDTKQVKVEKGQLYVLNEKDLQFYVQKNK